VLAVDLPGFGDSEKPDAAYDGSLFVCVIRGLLQHLELPSVTLVGNSFGGLLAYCSHLENLQSIDALVLVGSGGLQPFDEAARERAERVFSESSLLALTPAMQDAMFSPVFATDSEARQRYLEKQNAKLDREDFRAYARALARTIRFVMHPYKISLNDINLIHTYQSKKRPNCGQTVGSTW
jgi:pimeloyl-ACP methyl ester carboxylesterase